MKIYPQIQVKYIRDYKVGDLIQVKYNAFKDYDDLFGYNFLKDWRGRIVTIKEIRTYYYHTFEVEIATDIPAFWRFKHFITKE